MYYLYCVVNTKNDNSYSEFVIRKTKPKDIPFIANNSKEKLQVIQEEMSEKFYDKVQKLEEPFEQEMEGADKEFRKLETAFYTRCTEIEHRQAQAVTDFRNRIIATMYDTNPSILI